MSTIDYLVLGNAIAAQALAARLSQYDPEASIVLVDPGEVAPAWNIQPDEAYPTPETQEQLRSRQSSTSPAWRLARHRQPLPTAPSTDSPNWHRSGADDYNRWAKLVADERWSYDGLDSCFQRVESEIEEHVSNSSTKPETPLQLHVSELVRRIMVEGTQLSRSADGGSAAVALYTEEYGDQSFSLGTAYPLDGIDIIRSPIRRILFKGKVACGVELGDGRTLAARREVLVSAGAIKSAHLLLLSGIGPAEELMEHGIETTADVPHIGRNMHEHSAFVQKYTVYDQASPSIQADPPEYVLGSPVGLMLTASAPRNALRDAMQEDGEPDVTDAHSHLKLTRGHLRICALYKPNPPSGTNQDASASVFVVSINAVPSSRGSVHLRSSEPEDAPLVIHNHNSTETDRTVIRSGVRLATRGFETPIALRSFHPQPSPPKVQPLSGSSLAEVIDQWVEHEGLMTAAAAGTVAMGLCVDTNLKVLGVERLRVIDESVIPCPIGADYRAAAYAIAERGAELITLAWSQRDECTPF